MRFPLVRYFKASIPIIFIFLTISSLGQGSEQEVQNKFSASWLTYIEYAVIGIILFFQFQFWKETRTTIGRFKDTFPDDIQFKLLNTQVLFHDLQSVNTIELIRDVAHYSRRAAIEGPDIDLYLSQLTSKIYSEMPDGFKSYEQASAAALVEIDLLYGSGWKNGLKKINITLLDFGKENNSILNKIKSSINTYLLRNKGAVSDFNLLRDIVQRNLDTVEEEINATIPVPVYLGLMGTMMGIIVGLFGLPDIGSSAFLEGSGINGLIGGVKIAMIASFTGLFFTVSNSGFAFKGAKNKVEAHKNDFFTFLQTELLPVLSEGVTSGIIDLNRSIERFGDSFNDNVQTLDTLIRKNNESLMTQQKGIEILQRMDIAKIANVNVKVLGELGKSMSALEGLAHQLQMLDQFVSNSRALVERTQDIVGFSENIVQILNESKQLQMYLNSHFSQLEERGQIITNTVVKLDDVIDKSLHGLERHIHDRLQAVKDIKVTAEDLLQKEFDQNRNVLGKLEYLEPLKNEFTKYSQEDSKAQKDILQAINNMQQGLANNSDLLRKVLSQQKRVTIAAQIKGLFFRMDKK